MANSSTTPTTERKHERSLVLEGASALVGFGLRTLSGLAGSLLNTELGRRGETLKTAGVPAKPGTVTLTRTITIHKRIDDVWPVLIDPVAMSRAFAPSDAEERSHGTDLHVEAKGPLGVRLSRDLERIDIRDHELVAWTDARRSGLPDRLTVSLREAPGRRGTEVTAELVLSPPAGAIGRSVVRAFEDVPKQALLATALFKLRSLVETGEIAVSDDTSCRRGARS